MAVVCALQPIILISKVIFKTAQSVKLNRQQCLRLAERVNTLCITLEELQKVPDSLAFSNALDVLNKLLEECLSFVKQCSNYNWFKRALKSGGHKEQFADFAIRLQKSIQDLNLGLNVAQMFDSHNDAKDYKADITHLENNQKEILQLNKQSLLRINEMHEDQKDGLDILQQQLGSLQNQMKEMLLLSKLTPHSRSRRRSSMASMGLPEDLQISFHELEFGSMLAKGNFASIYKGVYQDIPVAIKLIHRQEGGVKHVQLVREIKVLSKLRSPYVVQLYGGCLEPERNCYVMEYAANGSLDKLLLKSFQQLDIKQKHEIAINIAKGLRYLHSKKILHRDLKSSNILLDKDFRAKISDFGLSKSQHASIATATAKTNNIAWQAPEWFIPNTTYTAAADIYSYGMILWQLFSGKNPGMAFTSEQELISKIMGGYRETLVKHTPKEYVALIKGCWLPKPTDRPNIDDIIKTLLAYNPVVVTKTSRDLYNDAYELQEKQKYEQALVLYHKSARGGYYRSQTQLGSIYLQGLYGAQQNKAKAASWFYKAAKQEHARAQYNFGTMLCYGDGVACDIKRGLKYLQAAAKQGDKSAEQTYKQFSTPKYNNEQSKIRSTIQNSKPLMFSTGSESLQQFNSSGSNNSSVSSRSMTRKPSRNKTAKAIEKLLDLAYPSQDADEDDLVYKTAVLSNIEPYRFKKNPGDKGKLLLDKIKKDLEDILCTDGIKYDAKFKLIG